MTRRNRLLLMAALALSLSAVLLVPACRWRVVGWARGEAFYRGRPTSYWAEWLKADAEPPVWREESGMFGELIFATRANRRIDVFGGPEAIPVLLQMLKSEDKDFRRDAAWALGKLGPAAHQAVPELTAAGRDEDRLVRRFAANALQAIDPQAARAAGVE